MWSFSHVLPFSHGSQFCDVCCQWLKRCLIHSVKLNVCLYNESKSDTSYFLPWPKLELSCQSSLS